jgi:hypothetical protein
VDRAADQRGRVESDPQRQVIVQVGLGDDVGTAVLQTEDDQTGLIDPVAVEGDVDARPQILGVVDQPDVGDDSIGEVFAPHPAAEKVAESGGQHGENREEENSHVDPESRSWVSGVED